MVHKTIVISNILMMMVFVNLGDVLVAFLVKCSFSFGCRCFMCTDLNHLSACIRSVTSNYKNNLVNFRYR